MYESLGHFKILDRLGTTGTGEVYRARDTKLGRTVAIKVLPPDVAHNTDRRGQILAEARASVVLSHPNIAALYEVVDEKDITYLVCEYVPGQPLTAAIASRSLNARRAIDFAIQLADAVADAHAEGIAHRSLGSSAIMVTPKEKVKILDFGFATWMKRPGAPAQPPEEVDFRADLTALGAILYEMVVGKQPPPAAIPPPSSTNPNLPKELDPIVLKALGRTPESPYESAATLAAELRSVAAILDVRSGDREPPTLVAARPPERTFPSWLVVTLVVAAIAGLVWLATRAA